MPGRTTHVTYCRICTPLCGLVVDVEDGRVVEVTGDKDHPLTQGFTCAKGRRIGDFHSDPERLLSSVRRRPDGTFEPIAALDAAGEVATRLQAIVDAHGPDAVGLFVGTQALTASLTYSFMAAWFRALGSRKRFATMTIDQSAKTVAAGRLGTWAGGRTRFADADVWMLVGTNPLVSMQGGELTGFPVHDGLRELAARRRRGMKLVVVDPRRTEVATHADLHVQLRPGTDAAFLAGIHHVLVRDGLVDHDFCDRWVLGLEELRAAVETATPDVVAQIAGVAPEQVVEAAHLFGRARRGMAKSGTGPDMGPWANLAEHLVQALNVVCGRFPREGDQPAGGGVLQRNQVYRAQAVSPRRFWDHSPKSRLGPAWMPDELMSPLLPAEILTDGPDRIRALVVVGGNPAAAFPGQSRILEALEDLELLVTIDPYLTETSRLAHYVIAPALALERADDTRGYEHYSDLPFAQHTSAVLPMPPDVIDDWAFFFELAAAMGLTLRMGRREYAPGDPRPTDEELLAARADGGYVDYADVLGRPHGHVFADVAAPVVEAPAADASGRFELLAPDVAEELASALAALADDPGPADRPFRLVVRRAKETMNSLGRRLPGLPRHPYNPCFAHPSDVEALGLAPGALVAITSAHGAIAAVLDADDTLRPGVLSMTHCFGGSPGLDDDPLAFGSNPTRLLSIDEDLQSINLMPLMSAVPVSVSPLAG
jgi:anaerobic selenocysteine-containing dehydrogenase